MPILTAPMIPLHTSPLSITHCKKTIDTRIVYKEDTAIEDSSLCELSSASSVSSEASTTPRGHHHDHDHDHPTTTDKDHKNNADSKPAVFVHDPYTWWKRSSPAYVPDESEKESPKIRIFCSSKSIPHTTNDEFLAHLGPVVPFITTVIRPRGGRKKEFLYVETTNEMAAKILLSYHPMKLRGQRLNISRASL